mmetsp:Transcript_1835/g.2581  ORF Transcript_1835/g.2581 Transcript_1835/m.2581 type:complete len:543 (+) Transcript_1835:135-1763(+)
MLSTIPSRGVFYGVFFCVSPFFVLSSQWGRSKSETTTNSYVFLPSSCKIARGGAQATQVQGNKDVFNLLALCVQNRLDFDSEDKSSVDVAPPDINDLVRAFKSMAKAQKTFKGLDGAAHEAYQLTHKNDEIKVGVSGRATRTAARTTAVASALGACELSELVLKPNLHVDPNPLNGTLANREVLFNETIESNTNKGLSMQVLVIFEPSYRGGAGVNYESIRDIATNKSMNRKINGRILVAVGVPNHLQTMDQLFDFLSLPPSHVRLHQGSVDEAASVQPSLYSASSLLLEKIGPILRQHNQSAFHFVGHSMGGGVACLAASILDGKLPERSSQKKSKKKNAKTESQSSRGATEDGAKDTVTANQTVVPLQGIGKGRTSAVAVGAPPCMSSNVQADFIVSIMHGDDFVSRASSESIERFFHRTRKALKKGFLGGQLNRMSDTFSLAASNLKNYAHGSEGEEARLSIPGRAYLIRPRRLGGVCSIHEIGSQLKGGREAIRASVLWQLNEILLSKSLWKHHHLESYIQALDRVQLRGLESGHSEQ